MLCFLFFSLFPGLLYPLIGNRGSKIKERLSPLGRRNGCRFCECFSGSVLAGCYAQRSRKQSARILPQKCCTLSGLLGASSLEPAQKRPSGFCSSCPDDSRGLEGLDHQTTEKHPSSKRMCLDQIILAPCSVRGKAAGTKFWFLGKSL